MWFFIWCAGGRARARRVCIGIVLISSALGASALFSVWRWHTSRLASYSPHHSLCHPVQVFILTGSLSSIAQQLRQHKGAVVTARLISIGEVFCMKGKRLEPA